MSPGFQSDSVAHDATTGRKCSAEGMFLDANDDWGLGYVDYAIIGGSQTWGWQQDASQGDYLESPTHRR